MTDRSFIVVPKTIQVNVQVSQTYAMLNTLTMLNEVDEFPGLDEWLVNLARSLSPELRHRNRLVYDGFYNIVFAYIQPPFQFLDFVATLEQADPEALRDKGMAYLLDDAKHVKFPELYHPSYEELLADANTYVDYILALQKAYEKDKCDDPDFLREIHSYFQNPVEAQNLIVNHSRYMWEHYLHNEWTRIQPVLEETVVAFQKINYSGMSQNEVIRVITGRDMSTTWIGEEAEKADQLTFIPVPHIGPYVGANHKDNWIEIFFRPHVPEGTAPQSAALNRSELLVRLNALADDSRLRILELFNDHAELCAQDIIQLLDLSQSAASRHLRQLTATGYLTERRREGAKCYRLNPERVTSTLQAIKAFLSIY